MSRKIVMYIEKRIEKWVFMSLCLKFPEKEIILKIAKIIHNWITQMDK